MNAAKAFRFLYDFGHPIHIQDYKVTAFLINDTTATPLDAKPVTQDASGFSLELPCAEGDYYYVIVKVLEYTDRNNEHTDRVNAGTVAYMALFKWDDTIVAVGPQSTVAGVYTFAQRITAEGDHPVTIIGQQDFKEVAYAMKRNFYNTEGGISRVISKPPNEMQTNSLAVFNFLSNLLYYSLTDVNVYDRFLHAVNSISGVEAKSSLEAMIAVAQHPFDNVKAIYDLLIDKQEIFTPSLRQIAEAGMEPMPDQWTLTIKINDSGAENFLISGTAYTVFDKDNKAWVTNNFR